jgi:hypothetical protein
MSSSLSDEFTAWLTARETQCQRQSSSVDVHNQHGWSTVSLIDVDTTKNSLLITLDDKLVT